MAYFANSSDDRLERQCDKCVIGQDSRCPILLIYMLYNYTQIGNDDLRAAMNLLVDDDGVCKTYELLKER